MKRLLLDQGLPRSTAALLSQRGWHVIHVSEIGLGRAEDSQVLRRARAEKRVWIGERATSFLERDCRCEYLLLALDDESIGLERALDRFGDLCRRKPVGAFEHPGCLGHHTRT